MRSLRTSANSVCRCGIKEDLVDGSVVEINGTQDVALLIIAENGGIDDGSSSGDVSRFVFLSGDPAVNTWDAMDFAVENQGLCATIERFRVEVTGANDIVYQVRSRDDGRS